MNTLTKNILTEVEDNLLLVENEIKHYTLKLAVLQTRLEQLNEQRKSIINYLNTEL